MKSVVDAVGRVVLPKPLRESLGLTAGSTVEISRYYFSVQTPPALFRRSRAAWRSRAERYDALIALAAIEHRAVLATRDARARDTYERVGASVVTVA